jgi:predicted small lipoprotein YifL
MYSYLFARLCSHFSLINRPAAIRFAGVLFVATVLSGCGNKGDLYLPEDVAATYQSPVDQNED